MVARVAFGRDYYEDIRNYQLRGWTTERIARELGMSRSSLYRIIARYEQEKGWNAKS